MSGNLMALLSSFFFAVASRFCNPVIFGSGFGGAGSSRDAAFSGAFGTGAFGVGAFTSLEEQVRSNMKMFERAFTMFAPFARRESAGETVAEAEKSPQKSGDIDDLYRHFGIDAETITGAAIDLIDGAVK